MKNKKIAAPPIHSENRIKLRINQRTIITVRNKQALSMWMEKYPEAQIID